MTIRMINGSAIHRMMVKRTIGLLSIILLSQFCFPQSAKEATRTSNIDYRLAKKEIKVFVVNSDSIDDIAIQIKSNRPVNLSVKDPDGFIREGKMLLGNRYTWIDFGGRSGAWEISLENLMSISGAKVSMRVTLTKDSFIFGSGSPKSNTILNPRTENVLTKGTFRIKKASPLSFPVGALKGDTILVDIMPESGRCPQMSITNDLGEWLHASKSARIEKIVTIPVFEDGETNIELEGASFLRVFASPFKQVFEIEVDKISPVRYTNAPDSIGTNVPLIDADTLIEVYLDTIIELGAGRDILHPNQHTIPIAFSDPESILFWGILYGSGKEFFNQLSALDDYPRVDLVTGKTIDIIEQIVNGEIRSVPRSNNSQIRFIPSEDIANALAGKNYGTVEFFNDKSSLKLVNKSKSVGQKVYVRVVSFRDVSE